MPWLGVQSLPWLGVQSLPWLGVQGLPWLGVQSLLWLGARSPKLALARSPKLALAIALFYHAPFFAKASLGLLFLPRQALDFFFAKAALSRKRSIPLERLEFVVLAALVVASLWY